MRIADDITRLVGGTPLVRLRHLVPVGGATILAKLEYFNPGGSVKDRIAVAMIDEAERQGLLHPGDTIVEPTSAIRESRWRWSAPRADTGRSSPCPKP